MNDLKIAYVVADLKRVGPSNQTLNIIKNSKFKEQSIVITLFDEPNDTMIDEYKNNNIKIICLHLGRIFFSVTGTSKLVKILKKENINLVHSYGIKSDSVCQKACKKINVHHVITLRNYPKEDILTRMGCLKGRVALYSHLKTLKKAKNVICCSKSIYNKMRNDYPNHEFSYIQNGVDIYKYKAIEDVEKNNLRKKYNLNENALIYISTGSFISRKRIDETIEGFIRANRKNSILILLGDGQLFEPFKMKYEKNKKVRFIGKSKNVAEYLQLSDVFVSSSESEGLPNGVIEAIATGLPVILSDIPQHKEILDELKNAGKTYRLGDITDLSELINDDNILLMGDDIGNSPFTMKNMSIKYQEYYKNLINQR